jgi:hypothetical protein
MTEDFWISPGYRSSDFPLPHTLDNKITLFLDRTDGWQLDIAEQCINGKRGPHGEITCERIPHSGFAVLHIVLSYFEMIAKYEDGFADIGQSERYFKRGIYSVFPELKDISPEIADPLVGALYHRVRCGLYHSGTTDPQVGLTSGIGSAMIFDPKRSKVIINPHCLIPALRAHLKHYGERLRDVGNSQLRENFEKQYDFLASEPSHP